MKVRSLKRIEFLVLGVLLLLLWNQGSATAMAAAPAFKDKEIEIAGAGEVYQLNILYKVKNSTYQWSSSDNSVAKVTKQGLVTSVNKGSAKIKCKITYASGKTRSLYCKVTVTIPAMEIEINNAADANGAHIMMVGESFNFNRTLTPANSTDETYWFLDASDEEASSKAVRIDDSSKGIVTALRRGKVVLVAAAAKKSSAEAAKESEVKDAIIIEVVGPSAEVVSAEMNDSKTITVVFGTAVRESSLIKADGTLTNNIEVAQLIDTSTQNLAKDPGILSAGLSSNMRTLTITAEKSFNGYYGITFTDKVLTTEGTPIYKDYFKVSYISQSSDGTADTGSDSEDNTNADGNTGTGDTEPVIDTEAPKVASMELDDTGMVTRITFTEQMNFTNININSVKVSSGSSEAKASTISYLNNEANYTFTSDGKTILIDLSYIDPADYNRTFIVTISGITDISGNGLQNNSIEVTVRTDTSPSAQARPISVMRTSYDIITAVFTRSIRTPGYAYVNSSDYCYGEVDTNNDKLVHYKMPAYDATLTGNQTVVIGFWDSYNVISTDTYANQMYSFSVFFTTEKVRPFLLTYDFNSDLKILTLTYSENVSLLSNYGSLAYTLTSYQYSGNTGFFEYSKASIVDNVVEICLSNITLYGDYKFTLPEGFILDDYHNQSYSNTITINNGKGEEGINKLAEPYLIHQSEENHSLIYVEFADKLDPSSALDINNYNISSAVIEEVKLISNNADGAKVQITLKKGSIALTGERKMMISHLKGYNGAYAEMADYTTPITLTENIDPVLKHITFDPTSKNIINLTFSEEVMGNMIVSVQERSTGSTIGNTVSISGETVVITLASTPADGTYLRIYVHDNSITDKSGNESTVNPVMSVFVNY